ncbi:hypothetical protein EYZ11_009971 [Aspergillus tanneri]|uniref:TRP C-terminal domain-containing protein n=1 Tax=Aspergillus tanneri TaxID=1220188 RepID=A0A4S3J6R2_9EURO|nr:hypothetical protein EYZ11_009971 [Aspergillus tanneri]
MYRPNSLWTWSFAIVTLIQTIITLALECFGFIYELVLVYDALRMKNTIQVIGLCLCNVGLLIYGAVQIQQVKEAVGILRYQHMISDNIWAESQPFLIIIPCVVGMGTILMSIIAWKLYDEFAWSIYKHISADLRMKRRYLTYQIYIALLKFDFFFFLGFTVQFVVIITNKSDVEFALTVAAVPVTIIILLLYFGAMAYFLFKLVRMYAPSTEPMYLPARRSLTFFAVITLILIVLTIVNAGICMHNFHKGLKPHINKKKDRKEAEKTTELSSNITGQVPNRMMID